MRHVLSILALVALLIGSAPTVSVIAQNSSLLDLLPTPDDIGPGFVMVDNRVRTLAEQATGFSNADEAARLLAGWNWQENAFAVFQTAEVTAAGAPLATLDISLTRFADATDASLALPYFLGDRADVLGQHELKQMSQASLGDESGILYGSVEGGYDTTLYVRSGALLIRISATSSAGELAISLERIAQGIIDRGAPQSPSGAITLMQPAVGPLLTILPLDHGTCFTVEGEGELDIPGVVTRLATGADASSSLQALGWQGGVYRQFACKPPPGRVGWVDISLHRFPDDRAAIAAMGYFAESRARSMELQLVPASSFGDSRVALSGPAINGTEYSLYLSRGSLLFAVTGVAPDSGSDPRADVEAIAAALLESRVPVAAAEIPTATPFVPVEATATLAPMPTATPLPTLVPIPVPTATPIPLPTATPLPTAAPPMLVALPTATPIVTAPPPPPTATPTPEAAPIPADVSSEPMEPLPTPTPRVIRPPTPAAG